MRSTFSMSDYLHLMTQLRGQLALRDRVGPLDDGRLRIDGRELQLQHDEEEPDGLRVRMDMGAVPENDRDRIWHRLLVSSHEWGADGLIGWSLSPDSGHVVLTAQHPLGACPVAGDLMGWLRQWIAAAQADWHALKAEDEVSSIRSLAALPRAAWPPAMDTTADWASLVHAFADHVGLPQRHGLLNEGDTVAVNGVDMRLRHHPAAPGRFEIQMNLGRDARIARERQWHGLLVSNFVLGATGRVLFGVHPVSDAVVMRMQQDLPVDADGKGLLDLLQVLASHAQRFWSDACDAAARSSTMPKVRQQLTVNFL